jgi:hypothetical protein
MKCIMIINRALPVGLIANTAAVLAVSIGRQLEGIVGEDVFDADGSIHPGITNLPISILGADAELIKEIRTKVIAQPDDDLKYIDFCESAQKSKVYDDYRRRLADETSAAIDYLGLALYGPRKKVESLTGNIALLK